MADSPASPTPVSGDARPRAELSDAPPFLTWRAIYLIVLGALLAEIAAGAVLTGLYR